MKKAVYLVDGYGLIYRSYFALLKKPLYSPEGRNTSAVYGFFRALLQLIRLRCPSYLAVVMDSVTPTFRHVQYPEYKANREETPQDLRSQIPVIENILDSLGVAFLRINGFEADDVIASIAAECRNEGDICYILSNDKDILQLVDDSVMVLNQEKSLGGFSECRRDDVFAQRGVYPEQIIDYLALKGDQSDNVPGVAGIGEKTAVKLLSEHGNIESIYENLEKIKSEGLKKKLVEGKQNAELSRGLVSLRTNVPLAGGIEELRLAVLNTKKAIPLFLREGMKNIVGELGGDVKEELKLDTVQFGNYELVTDVNKFNQWIDRAIAKQEFAFDIETDNLDEMTALPIGFSLSLEKGRACYIPLRAKDTECIKAEILRKGLTCLLNDPRSKLIGQNIKYDYKVLKNWGIGISNMYFDTMIAAWVLDSDLSSYGLNNLAERFLRYRTIHYDEVAGENTLAEVNVERVTDYAAEDADITLRLYHEFSKKLKDESLDRVFFDVEMPLIEVLAEMELTGIRILPEELREYERQIEMNLHTLEEQIFILCGTEFNINSTKQLQAILFDRLGLEPVKKTKTGYSTDTWVLQALANKHDVPKLVLKHRTLSKLKSTYIVTLPLQISPKTGRLHTHFIQTGTSTGRLSSKNPNLQNIPVREEEGRRIRNAFVPRPGSVLLSADYSQIELAILAHLSQDQMLLNAFREGRDIHNQTAALIFGIPGHQVSSEQRRVGKTINFGVIYGMSSFRLSRDLNIGRDDANRFIETYFRRYWGVDGYIKQTTEQAEENGWVETISGRKRRIRSLKSANKTEKMAASRIAVNSPIQGSAADIVKMAMIKVVRRLEEKKLHARLLLQVHDELIFEIPKQERAAATDQIKRCMEEVVSFDIPLRVKISVGDSWGAL